MSAITFSIDFTGTPDSTDVEAAKLIIQKENDRRAALDPPEAALPDGTGAELKTSYLSLLADIVANAHGSYANQAAAEKLKTQSVESLWASATDAQRTAAIAALQA
jgi:hypothetical protein